MRVRSSDDGSMIELADDDHIDHDPSPTNTEIVAYDPAFAKPYYSMSIQEKKAWRRGNRRRFVAAGYGLTTVGGGTLFGGVEMLKGASLMNSAAHIIGFEIIATAVFLVVAGLAALMMLLPWEDA